MIENNYEEIELAGHKYRFFTEFPAMRFMQFRSAYRNVAKKIIYASMLEMGEINSAIGYQMIKSDQADAWIRASGFEELDFLRVLCAWIAEPLDFKKDDKGVYLEDADKRRIPEKSVLEAVIEFGEEGIGILRIFFIRLITPIGSQNKKQTNSASSSKKAGKGKKASLSATEQKSQ
jgi:hypothetical protein